MKLKFLKYDPEQLLEERSFVSYVLRDENKKEWEEFIATHVEFKSIAEEAREILFLFKNKNHTLDQVAVLELWNSISHFEQKAKLKEIQIRKRRIFSMAASVVLLISVGISGFLFINDKNNEFRFNLSENTSTDSRIILSTGEEIKLNKDNSTIVLDDSSNHIAVNDSVIKLNNKAGVQKREVRMNEVIIPYGQKSELLLADGTKVWLNAGSRFAFPTEFTRKTREVYLEGEACFEVVEDKNKPFIVKTGNLNIKVLGTQFNVSAYPSDETIETVLLHGSVALSNPNVLGFKKNEVVLIPNQKARFIKEEEEFTVTHDPNVELSIAWTYGFLKYDKESLHSILRKIERYYNVEIRIPADYPTDDMISGKLNLNESLDEMLSVLSVASGFIYNINEGIIFIEIK